MTALTNVADPSPHQLRDIVIGYLLNNCYTNTARVLARESATSNIASHTGSSVSPQNSSTHAGFATVAGNLQRADTYRENESSGCDEEGLVPREYLRLTEVRREIKMHILCGRIDEATQLLNKHFPLVLNDSESEGEHDAFSTNRSTLSRGELDHRRMATGSHANFARTAASGNVQLTTAGGTMSSPYRRRVSYTSPNSLKPVHLSLNLQILGFIEATRSVPLPHPCSNVTTNERLQVEDESSLRSNEPESPSPETASPPDEQQTILLHHAQRLYAKVQSLADTRDRERYKKEVMNVVGLLAYRKPETSPMARYMKQERRDAVADQINSAVLHRTGQSVASSIELHARQTSVIFDSLRTLRCPLPPPAQRPHNITTALKLLLDSSTELESTTPIAQIKAGRERENNEYVPIFEFSKFVAS